MSELKDVLVNQEWQPVIGEKFWYVYVNKKSQLVIRDSLILNENMLRVILESKNYYRTYDEAGNFVCLAKKVIDVVKENEKRDLERWVNALDSDECKIALTGEK